jgi:hypothetical protein
MNTVPFIDQFVAAAASKRIACVHCSPVFDALEILIIRGDIENSDLQPKCGDF